MNLLGWTWLAACSGASNESAPPEPIRIEARPAEPAAEEVPAVRVGPALPPPSAVVPDLPALPLLLTVHTPPANCDPAPVVAAFGTGCVAARVAEVRVSGNVAGAERAVDGSTCTVWNSGGTPPAAISIALAEGPDVAGIVLVADAMPLYPLVTHVVETSDDGESFVPAFRLRGITNTEIPFSVVFPTPIHRRHLRVVTASSPSWVAWREVIPFVCDGPAVAPAGAIPALQEVPAPPPDPAAEESGLQRASPGRIAIGRGHCRRDADCAIDRCCQPQACVPRGRAPRCRGISCPAVVGPLDGSECVCHEGTCAAEWPATPPAED